MTQALSSLFPLFLAVEHKVYERKNSLRRHFLPKSSKKYI